MTFEEAFNKYLKDDDFKKEVKASIENNDFKEIIIKYDLSYSETELASLINERAEAANCKDKEEEAENRKVENRKAELKEEIVKYETLKEIHAARYEEQKKKLEECPVDSPERDAINASVLEALKCRNSFEAIIKELQEELDNL